MASRINPLDAAFLNRQKKRLLTLRRELLGDAAGEEANEADERLGGEEGREPEDDAQKLAALELDGLLVARNVDRVAVVERAIKKIEDGTYGFSDVSGAEIPRARLEALPEASWNVGETPSLEQ